MNIGMMKIKEVVRLIVKAADGIKLKQRRSDLEFGELLGYTTCLNVFQDMFILNKDKKAVGLGFDPEVRYLGGTPRKHEEEPEEEDEELSSTEMALAITERAVAYIVRYADGNRSQQNPDDVDIGELLGYVDCLRIIREVFHEDPGDVGIDFDPDERYLNAKAHY